MTIRSLLITFNVILFCALLAWLKLLGEVKPVAASQPTPKITKQSKRRNMGGVWCVQASADESLWLCDTKARKP